MAYTLGQASKATGVSKPTISRYIARGKISAARNQDGSYSIEPVELHRVFQPVPPNSGSATGNVVSHETNALQRENDLLREVVSDLRRRLDQEAEERRRLTLMITDQRPWWRKVLRR